MSAEALRVSAGVLSTKAPSARGRRHRGRTLIELEESIVRASLEEKRRSRAEKSIHRRHHKVSEVSTSRRRASALHPTLQNFEQQARAGVRGVEMRGQPRCGH